MGVSIKVMHQAEGKKMQPKQQHFCNMSIIFLHLILLYLMSSITITNCSSLNNLNKLEIYPTQAVHSLPIGKSHILTCHAIVEDSSLLSQFQWKDQNNITIPSKTSRNNNLDLLYSETLSNHDLALLFSPLQKSMAGTYYCSATYANTQYLESSAIINTFEGITFKNAPENQYPILGTDYLVRCEVTAKPNPSIDWIRNGPIRGGPKYVIETHGLLIRNVQESDDGVYTCRAVVVETGELKERNIRIEVYSKPIITYLPEGETEAVEGQSFSMNCTASGKPVPEITWTKDSTQQNLITADRFQVNSQTGLLNINRVEESDMDSYTCHAKNAAGFTKRKMKLNILVPPKIFEFYNQTIPIKKEVAITCRARGRPAPDVTFRRWGSDENYVEGLQPTDDRIVLEQYYDHNVGESYGTLRISNVNRTDDGLYQCVAMNKENKAFKTGHIAVEFPPNFDHMKLLPPLFSWAGHKVNLSCLAMGIPNATIEWRWNGRPIKEIQDQNLEIVVAGPRSDLIVRTAAGGHYYSVYKCIATNIHGIAEHDIQLKEARIPDSVISAMPKAVTATSVTFDIIGPPTELGLPILAFYVQYKEEFQPDWSLSRNRSWSPDSLYIVEGLNPQTSYTFRFASGNLVGLSMWGAYKIQSTSRRSQPEPPKLLHRIEFNKAGESMVQSQYSNFFTLKWSVPVDNGEPIDFYEIKYCKQLSVDENEWIEFSDDCIRREVPAGSNSLDMSHLNINTFYKINVRAHNIIGYSQITEIILKTSVDDDSFENNTINKFTSSSVSNTLKYHAVAFFVITTFTFVF